MKLYFLNVFKLAIMMLGLALGFYISVLIINLISTLLPFFEPSARDLVAFLIVSCFFGGYLMTIGNKNEND